MAKPQITARAGGDAGKVDLELLLYFTAVAEEASFTRAAARMGIDQSWLSRKIRQLEAQLGCALMVRTTRRVELTAAGDELLVTGRQLSEVAECAREHLKRLAEKPAPRLRLGALPYSFTDPARIELIHDFARVHPEVDIEVSNNASWKLADLVRSGRIDVAFASSPFEVTGLDVLVTIPNLYAVMVPEEHPFANLEAIGAEHWPNHHLVVPPPARNPYTFEAVYRPFLDAGAIPAPTPEFERFAMRRFAHRNRWPILMNISAGEKVIDTFVAKPILAQTPCSYKCILRRQSDRSPATSAFWKFARARTRLRFRGVRPDGAWDVG